MWPEIQFFGTVVKIVQSRYHFRIFLTLRMRNAENILFGKLSFKNHRFQTEFTAMVEFTSAEKNTSVALKYSQQHPVSRHSLVT